MRLGYDRALLAKVAERLARAVMQDMRWSAKERHGLATVEFEHFVKTVYDLETWAGTQVPLSGTSSELALHNGGADEVNSVRRQRRR